MDIQPLEFTDLDFVRHLQPPDWSDIVPIHQFYLNSSFCHPIKITVNHKVVGIGTLIIHPDTAWLAHIIVDPNYRNNGIGKFITESLLDNAQGKETIYLLATDLGAPVYKKLGFVTETEYDFYKGGSIDQHWHMHPKISLYEAQYKTRVLALDALCSGEDRAMRLEGYLPGSFLCIDDDKVEGFYIPGLGEGLVVASNPDAGIALMKFRLTSNEVAVIPQDNKPGVAFLEQNGFIKFRRAQRMRLGKPRTWQPAFLYNRVSGQIG